MVQRNTLPRGATCLARTGALLLIAACAPDSSTAVDADATLGEPEIIILRVDPDTATVDTTVIVRIIGSGFTDSSTVTWLTDTIPASSIRTLSTTWQSEAEIHAVIAIAPDAPLRSYSVRIRGKKGKQGIGAERFRVVAKPLLLPEPGVSSEAVDVNDSDTIVGTVRDAAGNDWAIIWTPGDSGWRHQIIGMGFARRINRAQMVIWTRWNQQTPEIRQSLVRLPSGVDVDFGQAYLYDISDNGTLIGALPTSTGSVRPVIWRALSASSWAPPEEPPGVAAAAFAYLNAINRSGDIAGVFSNGVTERGVVWPFRGDRWESPLTIDAAVNGGAFAINSKGELAGWVWPCSAGPACYAYPAYWPAPGAVRRILPTLYNTRGWVNGMNDSGLVVGAALVQYNEGTGPAIGLQEHAVVWFPGSLFPEDLGAIYGSQLGEARAINNRGLVAGFLRGSDRKNHATAWRLPGVAAVTPPE